MTKHHDFIIIKAEIARLFFRVSKNVQGLSFFFLNKGRHSGTDQSWGVFSSTSDSAAFQFQLPCWNKCSIPRAQQLAVLQPSPLPASIPRGEASTPGTSHSSPCSQNPEANSLETAFGSCLLVGGWGPLRGSHQVSRIQNKGQRGLRSAFPG